MKNSIKISIMLSFLASMPFVHAMEKEECNKPLSYYPTIVQAYKSLQDAYNNKIWYEKLTSKAEDSYYAVWSNLIAISKPSFLEQNIYSAQYTLEQTITELARNLQLKQYATKLPAGGMSDEKQQFFDYLSKILYQLHQFYDEIQKICPKK